MIILLESNRFRVICNVLDLKHHELFIISKINVLIFNYFLKFFKFIMKWNHFFKICIFNSYEFVHKNKIVTLRIALFVNLRT